MQAHGIRPFDPRTPDDMTQYCPLCMCRIEAIVSAEAVGAMSRVYGPPAKLPPAFKRRFVESAFSVTGKPPPPPTLPPRELFEVADDDDEDDGGGGGEDGASPEVVQ